MGGTDTNLNNHTTVHKWSSDEYPIKRMLCNERFMEDFSEEVIPEQE